MRDADTSRRSLLGRVRRRPWASWSWTKSGDQRALTLVLDKARSASEWDDSMNKQ
jgi:hypothetical protein